MEKQPEQTGPASVTPEGEAALRMSGLTKHVVGKDETFVPRKNVTDLTPQIDPTTMPHSSYVVD